MAEESCLTPMELFNKKDLVKIAAPMVRYSKLAFRTLVRKYNADLCFTPMIVADSFMKSEHARNSDFTTSIVDRPLIVQFAARCPEEFTAASQLVYNYCDGVDLNCGCPQRWAIQEGFGACLLHKPEVVSDIIKQLKNAFPSNEFTVSIKMRILKDYRRTLEFVRQLEHAGVSFISVHGRTKEERGEPVDLDSIAAIKNSSRVPIIANGDVKSLEEAKLIQQLTRVDGVMCARGLLANPSMFSGTESTTLECMEDWIRISLESGTSFTCFHNHLIYMMEKSLCRADRRYFNALGSVPGVVTFLRQKYNISIWHFFSILGF